MESKSTRDAYGDTLLKIGNNDQIIVLDADLSVSTQTNKFAKKFPHRFFNTGCAEQNLVGISAGFALNEKIVFASTYSIFLMRAWEQIRNISYDNLNIKLTVTHSGLTNGPDGASHQSLEDLAIMRVIPNMTVIIPCDAIETEKIIISEINRKGPAYIRLNRAKTPIIYNEDYEFKTGKVDILKEGDDLTIIATGTMVHEALSASKILKNDYNIDSSVVNMSTLKPLDKNEIIKIAKKTGRIVTVEEHSIYGGLGSTISEILSEEYPVKIKMIGMNDMFGESGEYRELLSKYGLISDNIVIQSRLLLNKN